MTRRSFVGGSALTAVSASRIRGANDRIGIGILGAGRRNLLGQALEFRNDANVEVRAVCDIWRQQREAAAGAVQDAAGATPELIHGYDELLARDDIDAVIIGTPDHQHCTQLVDSIRAGKDVYVEKPLAMDMKELKTATDAVTASDRVVQMGTQVRSFPSSVAARRFIQSGGLGEVFKIEQSRNSYKPYWYRYAERMLEEKDTDWKAFLMHREGRRWDPRQYAGWFGYRDFSRGPHSNLAVHFFDLTHYLMDVGPPDKVTASGGSFRWNRDGFTAPDSVEVVLEYSKPRFLVRYNTTFGVRANSFLKLFGTRGEMDASRWQEPFRISGEAVEDEDRIAAGATIPAAESTPHMLNFFQCMRSRETPNAPIEAGYSHAVAVLMAEEALRRGRRMVYDAKKRRIREG